MDSIPRSRKAPGLTAAEREVVAVYNDADKIWRFYSDSATLRSAMLRLARRIGAEVRLIGTHGIEFEAPIDALRLTARRTGHRSRTSFRAATGRPVEGKVALLARA